MRIPVVYSSTQTPQVAKTLTALTTNAAQAKAYQAAVLTSIERAQGANRAKKKVWEQKQNKAARAYAAKAAAALSRTPGLIRSLGSALQAVGYGSAAMTAADVAAFQQEVRSSGLPKEVTATVTILGAPGNARTQLKTDVLNASPDELAALSFPAILSDPGISRSIKSAAAVMRQLARG